MKIESLNLKKIYVAVVYPRHAKQPIREILQYCITTYSYTSRTLKQPFCAESLPALPCKSHNNNNLIIIIIKVSIFISITEYWFYRGRLNNFLPVKKSLDQDSIREAYFLPLFSFGNMQKNNACWLAARAESSTLKYFSQILWCCHL